MGWQAGRIGRGCRWLAGKAGVAVLCVTGAARSESYEIGVPGGSVEIEISHIDSGGSLVAPAQPAMQGFRPPVIFSAPLPSGSGARALGFAGAFTAVADDATAASWNPAGLTQLETPEASFVLRYIREANDHRSESEDYRVGEDAFDNAALNYLSASLPFRLLDRNWVLSLNYQEAYDFTQRFTADIRGSSSGSLEESSREVYHETQVDHFEDESFRIDVTSHITTFQIIALDQLLASGLLTGLEFDQEGVIDAVTPALAVELTPKFSVGAALNIYQDDLFGGQSIQSHTRARYTGDSSSIISVEDQLITTGWYSYEGVSILPGGGGLPPLEVPISGSGVYSPFSDTTGSGSSQSLRYEGIYDEYNRFDQLHGLNATLGTLWTVSRRLGLGFCLDLPWEAEAEQTKTVRNTVTTYDGTGTRVLDVSGSEQVEVKDVTFDFPLQWTLGSVWRWDPRFYTTVDVSQTWWSDFAFQAAGEPKLNPLDGSPYGQNPIDDCWAVRTGAEYLWVLRATEIPLRAGASWEQRPAIGTPDQYWGVSLGSGISLGKEPGKVILDVAYSYIWSEDALGSLVPGQTGIATDVARHEVFVSCIRHF